MRRLRTALLILGFLILGCGKNNPQPELKHIVSVPSTNCYVIVGKMVLRAGAVGPGQIQYSMDGTNFIDIPYINRTFGESEHWYELEVNDTQLWVRVLSGASTNSGTVDLVITRE